MEVCRFWLQNRCRDGSACKFEHPAGGASSGGSNAPSNPQRPQKSQNPPQNQFSGLHGRHGGGHAPRRNPGAGDRDDMIHRFQMSAIAIQQELLEQPPQWILSAYGPGINTPSQLFGGAREMSPEEMRVGHYLAVAAGRGSEAIAQANNMYSDALNQMRRAGADAQGAIDYVLDLANTHPNRVDVCAQRTTMGAPGAAIRPPFEIQPPKPFMGSNPPPAQAAPTLAPLVTPARSAVAEDTRFGPGLGPTTQIAFKEQVRQARGPAAPTVHPTAALRNPFGGGSAPAPTNPFATAAAANPFASASRLAVPTQPSAAAPANPFAPAAQKALTRTAARAPVNPFAATAQSGQLAITPPPNPTNPLAIAAPPTSTNPPAASGVVITMNNPYPPDCPLKHPDVNEYSTRDANNKLLTWKGKPVTYKEGKPCFQPDGSDVWQRIWHPNGPPAYNPNTELPLSMYDERTKEAYRYLREHGRFPKGFFPMLPPRREWSRWDF